jgi:hypothetical protein
MTMPMYVPAANPAKLIVYGFGKCPERTGIKTG